MRGIKESPMSLPWGKKSIVIIKPRKVGDIIRKRKVEKELKFMIRINHTFPDIPSPDEQQSANGKISPIIL